MTTAKPKVVKKEVVVITEEVPKGLEKKPKVTLISYAMKMVIPTGNYANIQPEIVVKAGTVEEAHDYIAPHMNKLWKEYYMVGERRPEPVTPPKTQPVAQPVIEATPVSSVAFIKATQAVQSCLSIEALKLIDNQIAKSVKLTEEDKKDLAPLVDNRYKELQFNG